MDDISLWKSQMKINDSIEEQLKFQSEINKKLIGFVTILSDEVIALKKQLSEKTES